jgi:hypothetical protein
VILYGNHTNIANTKIFANQDVDISWVENMGGVEVLSHLLKQEKM